VPALFDEHTRTIVNNESFEIIRVTNDAFAGTGRAGEHGAYQDP
jgi:glutathionyl-hydroquinone reductase